MKFKRIINTFSVTLLCFGVQFATAQRNSRSSEPKTIKIPTWQVDTLINPIPINRLLFTDKIANLIKRFDLRDGSQNNEVEFRDAAGMQTVTKALLKDIPAIVIMVENMELDHFGKIRYHRATEAMTTRLANTSWGDKKPSYFSETVENMRGLILADYQNRLLDYVKQHPTLATLNNTEILGDNREVKSFLFTALGRQYPEIMIKRLPEIMNEPYADPLIAAAAKVMPGKILSFAKSSSNLAAVVARNEDPLVQSIVKIARESNNTLKALPFLGPIYRGDLTIKQVDAFSKTDLDYFKALVDLEASGETMATENLGEELSYRSLAFVRKINELHERPNAERFASIQSFRDRDLYMMMIGGQDEIYTSSFTNGSFPLMMAKMKPKSGNDFLTEVKDYKFRTFLRMCAGYNELSSFLGTFEGSEKAKLMKKFVANLEAGPDYDLEDAVDVADAFGSIHDKDLLDFLIKEVKWNYDRVYAENNRHSLKGVVVYGLLSTIFNNADKTESLNANLNDIPPITYIPHDQLVNDSGVVIQQIFFYGDEDGKTAYNNYLTLFGGKEWKMLSNQYWTTITSTGKNKIVIYANKPLTEPQDEEAQGKLAEYLSENGISPSIVIHRGHSYFLPTTLATLTPSVKIVMLGSCGGYHNLANVLDRAPDANIISSKQIGALNVNVPIIKEINDQLLAGKDMNWINMWEKLSTYFSKRPAQERDYFSDYIPPNKNLGAIFIKAYRKATQS